NVFTHPDMLATADRLPQLPAKNLLRVEQRQAIESYTSAGHEYINGHLRGQIKLDPGSGIKDYVEDLQTLMKPTSQDLVVERYMKFSDYSDMGSLFGRKITGQPSVQDLQKLVGAKFKERG